MILEQFLRETKNMVLSHIYFDEAKLTIFDTAKKEYPHFKSFNINDTGNKIPPSDFLIIEIGQSSKDKLKALVSILTKSKPLATYIFADDVENGLLLKFALHFGISDVLPLKNDDNLLISIFTKNPNKLDDKIDTFKRIEIEKKISHSFALFLFKDDRLIYANTKAFSLMEDTNLSLIEERLRSDEELSTLLTAKEDAQSSIVIENEFDEKLAYLCLVKHFPQQNEKLLTMIHYKLEEEQKNRSSILNRFDFIEILKDKLVQQSITDGPLSLIFINISNLDKLTKAFKGSALHESFKKFLSEIFQLKEENQEVAQWSPNLYIILCENLSFVRACEQTRHIQQVLINISAQDAITPIITSSALMTEKSDLNEVINYIEKINTKSLAPQDLQKIHFYEIDYLENVLEESEQISYLVRNCFNNKIPIKLLNIYKGLCISTNSHILKINDNTYHLHCENLQGYTMQLEGETVLQAPNFPKDIKAEVSLVDIKKSFVILKNLNFMSNSANNRQHTRVQTSFRTPILIKYGNKATAQGEILDISVNSIAIKVSNALKENITNHMVKLNFSLPCEEGDNGYVVMDIEVKVTYVGQMEDHTKLVVMLGNLKKPYDDYLLNYMYSRQKELILEIRRATKNF